MMMDNDMPKAMGFLQSYRRGMSDYSQAGEMIPDLRLQNRYEQEMGGPLMEENLISGNPVFVPDEPGYGPVIPKEKFMEVLEDMYPGARERVKNAVPNLMKRASQLRGV
jgi:hypothetical protein